MSSQQPLKQDSSPPEINENEIRLRSQEDLTVVQESTPEARRQTLFTWLLVAIGIVSFAVWRPDTAQTIGIFIVELSILVFVHEWGHYQFARWGGMKVHRFGIGFPPWIFTVRRNDIDYSIGALPIGGMVDIAGLGSEEEMVATAKGEDTTTPTRVAQRNVPHGQRQFQEAALGWRFWTLFAGPLMNFLFAFVVFVSLFTIVGVPINIKSNNVSAVAPDTPAENAGLRTNDRIKAINGRPTKDSEEVKNLITAGKGKAVTLEIERDGQILRKTIKPEYGEFLAEDGQTKVTEARIGVVFMGETVSYQRVGLVTAVQAGCLQSYAIMDQIFGLLRRASTGNLTKDDKRGVGGPVKIAQAIGETAKRSWYDSIALMAALSVNLGLMNLLPIPALDGGRILFVLYELVMRRPLDPRKEGYAHMVGMVFLLAFIAFITLRDVAPMLRRLFS